MAYTDTPTDPAPTSEAVQARPGLTVLEFGTGWCGHCRAAQNGIRSVLQPRADIQHTKVEDGPGRPLGRRFKVKLWPTLVLLRDGQEVARTVRPTDAAAVQALLDAA